ncbi:MAG: YdcF family protein, partial [Firmicutes bacterium]|nr:YdcF family protein [Bacillota bacterium]
AYTLPLMEAQGARQVVVVTSNYHVRRARLAFRRLYEPAGLQVAVHGAPDPGFHPDGWWQEPLGREYGLLELMKLLWYLVT